MEPSIAYRTVCFGLALIAAALSYVSPTQARVVRIVVDSTTPLTGQTVPYEQIRGRAFGELDPNDSHNTIITDIGFGADADGKVRYEATFVLTKPVDLSNASGFMWHDVPNRGGAITIVAAERNLGDVGLASAWQGDNAGATAIPTNHATGTNHWVAVPMAKQNGESVTGTVLGRIVNRSGPSSQPLNVMGNPIPYLPATLDTTQAVLTTHTRETLDGVVTPGRISPAAIGRSRIARQRILFRARLRT